MIEQMENHSAGSTFGPLIVMIDASRLSQSLATALKDRPHGIPVQPNRSLPLRPPPPLPTRHPVSKSPKNSPTTQATDAQRAAKKSCGTGAITKDYGKEFHPRSDAEQSLGVSGMNFYDSKGEERGSGKYTQHFFAGVSKGIGISRHTKSSDNYGSEEGDSCRDKRRTPSEREAISRDLVTGRKALSNFESAGDLSRREKKRHGRKRKSSGAEENGNIFGGAKSPRVINSEGPNPMKNSNPITWPESTEDPVSKLKNFTSRVESSAMGCPTIHKNRHSEFTPPRLADGNTHSKAPDCADHTSNWKRTSSKSYQLILPKSAKIPKCPVAIPIKIAQAMNQGDLRNSNTNGQTDEIDISTYKTGSVVPIMNQNNLMEPNNNVEMSRTCIPQTLEDIENTLPSMPSLEDVMQSESLQEKLTVCRNQADSSKNDADSDKEPMPMLETRVSQIPGDLLSTTTGFDLNGTTQETVHFVHDYNFNQSQESIANFTTVLKIQIPGRSPELIILQTPEIMDSGKGDSVATNSPVEATIPVSLSSSIQPALEESRIIEEPKQGDERRGCVKESQHEYQTSQETTLQKYCVTDTGLSAESSPKKDYQLQSDDLVGEDQPQYTLQHKSPVEYKVRIRDSSDLSEEQDSAQKDGENGAIKEREQDVTKNSQVKPEVEEAVRYRNIKLNLKLRRHYREEARLKHKMSQTNDLSRLTRLQQKVNCAQKKIENTIKYLSKSPLPSGIQVRSDLIPNVPEPDSLESASQSPLHPITETDMASTRRSLSVSPPIITISETDSDSSDDEADANGRKSPDNIKPVIQSDAELEFNCENITVNDTKVTPVSDNTLLEDKEDVSSAAIPEMTNNNVEHFNKNIPLVLEGAPTTVNIAALTSPENHEIPKTASISIPTSLTRVNTASLSNPQVSTSAHIASMSIPPLIRDPIDYSVSNSNGFVRQKSPNTQYEVPNLNLPPEKLDKESSKPSCECLLCLQQAKSTVPPPSNPCAPDAANDLRTASAIRRTAIHENTNINPVPNYPVQRTDYRTIGNTPGTFSRDNGGANINLSSPLQGHSALPLPPPYYRNLTAQGYPIPTEPSPTQQTLQWHSQHPSSKSSMPLTPDQDAPLHTSLLAAHLLKPHVQDPVSFSSSMKLSSPAQSKDATRTNPTKHINERIMTTQFPTLANWAAQMTGESTTARKPVNNPNSDRTGYKTTGSDMYKMSATTIDPIQPQSAGVNAMHWASGRPYPAEQPRPAQGYPNQRNVPLYPYQRDYPANPYIPQNPQNGPARYPGSEMFVPYLTDPHHQVSSGPQITRSTEHSNSQLSHGQQNMPQYQSPMSAVRPLAPMPAYQRQKYSEHLMNPMGYMPQQYLQQTSPYAQTMLPQWQSANHYQNNYINPHYTGYNVQSKPTMEQNSTLYKPGSKNLPPMQPQLQRNPTAYLNSARNASYAKLSGPMYNVPGMIQEGRNREALHIGRSHLAPQLSKVPKNSQRFQNLRCSGCGTLGSKFSCIGCETAFYCNEHCQAQHWNMHLFECSKKMPKLKKVS